jgi:hypothetical protein
VSQQRPLWFQDWEAWCFFHIQAIQVAIDQYAEAALGIPGVLPQQAA